MDTLIVSGMLIGVCLGVVGWIWSMIVAGKIHVGWVLGMLIASVITVPWFAIKYWDKAKRPFIVWIIGSTLLLGSMLMLPSK